MEEILARIEKHLERIDAKLDNHIDRLARLEEQHKNSKGTISIILSLIVTALGWVVYKARF
jgi:hypothetical protein